MTSQDTAAPPLGQHEQSVQAPAAAEAPARIPDSDTPATGVRKRDNGAVSQLSRKVTAEQLLTASTDPRALLPLPIVCTLISLCRASLYKMVKDGTFPAPIKIGNASRWKAAQVHEWLQAHGGGEAPTLKILTDGAESSTSSPRQMATLSARVDALAAQAETLTKLVDHLHRRLSKVGQALILDR